MRNWLYLAITIIGEVVATSALKSSNGFTKPLPSAVVIAGYGVAFYFLSLALKSIPVGVAYAIWAGVGIVLVATVAMVLLSSLGVDIGPLIAGAGVVGLAIGLGAQQTIADILAGVFLLIEDAFHVGDYVEVGDLRGTVEGISLRSLKLRHHRGAVHTLPFGQMKSLTNYTRDWALMRLEFRVAPETDVGLVKRIVKQIGKELSADPEMAGSFIEPLKSQGIRNVEDGALVLGVKYIAKPGQQFVIRREAYQRILAAFREHDIALVGRGVVVKVEGADGTNAKVAAGAGAETARRRAST